MTLYTCSFFYIKDKINMKDALLDYYSIIVLNSKSIFFDFRFRDNEVDENIRFGQVVGQRKVFSD